MTSTGVRIPLAPQISSGNPLVNQSDTTSVQRDSTDGQHETVYADQVDSNHGVADSTTYTVLLVVTGDEEIATYIEYAAWMTGLRDVIGATTSTGDPTSNIAPWTVGDLHGRWVTDVYGHRVFDRHPYANVWQTGIGGDVCSLSMAYVWTAIHLIDPIERAGYNIQNTWAGRSHDLVLIG